MSQLAREYILKYIWNQTMCVGSIKEKKGKNSNSQITKARNILLYYNVNIFMWSSLKLRFFNMKLKELKYICVSKWVGISEAIRLMFDIIYNIIKNAFMLFEAENNENKYSYKEKNRYDRALKIINELNLKHNYNDNKDYNEWLAGVIDGDGYLNVSKKGTVRLIITVEDRDLMLLEDIKSKLGGSIYKTSGAKAYKYQLSNLKGLMDLVLRINGLIRNPIRMLQLDKVCKHYGLLLKVPNKLTYNNGWFSGLIDSDGSIYINPKIKRVNITVSQKNIYILSLLQEVYGGKIYPHSSKKEAFKYEIYRKEEVKNLVENYFSRYPLKSAKINRLNLIYEAFNKFSNLDLNNPLILKEWIEFKDKWDNYKK